MAECCDWGKMVVTVDGQIVSARGSFTLRPTTDEYEAIPNEDGSMSRMRKPVLAEAEGAIASDCRDLHKLWGLCNVTVTFTFSWGSWVFSDASITGRPELNTENGEMSGFKVTAPVARRV